MKCTVKGNADPQYVSLDLLSASFYHNIDTPYDHHCNFLKKIISCASVTKDAKLRMDTML
jgi:hypothetical protein